MDIGNIIQTRHSITLSLYGNIILWNIKHRRRGLSLCKPLSYVKINPQQFLTANTMCVYLHGQFAKSTIKL